MLVKCETQCKLLGVSGDRHSMTGISEFVTQASGWQWGLDEAFASTICYAVMLLSYALLGPVALRDASCFPIGPLLDVAQVIFHLCSETKCGGASRFQLRCLMETPLHVQPGHVIIGELRLAAHNRQSYDVFVTLNAPPLHPGQPPQQVHLSETHPLSSCPSACLVPPYKGTAVHTRNMPLSVMRPFNCGCSLCLVQACRCTFMIGSDTGTLHSKLHGNQKCASKHRPRNMHVSSQNCVCHHDTAYAQVCTMSVTWAGGGLLVSARVCPARACPDSSPLTYGSVAGKGQVRLEGALLQAAEPPSSSSNNCMASTTGAGDRACRPNLAASATWLHAAWTRRCRGATGSWLCLGQPACKHAAAARPCATGQYPATISKSVEPAAATMAMTCCTSYI